MDRDSETLEALKHSASTIDDWRENGEVSDARVPRRTGGKKRCAGSASADKPDEFVQEGFVSFDMGGVSHVFHDDFAILTTTRLVGFQDVP